MKRYISFLLLAGSLTFGTALAQTQASPAVSAPVPSVSQKDTSALIKQRLKAYKAQQKQSMRLAKAQTQLALEQLKLAEITSKTTLQTQLEQAKANVGK